MGDWSAYSFSVAEQDYERLHLTELFHIVHIGEARLILEAGKIHAQSVYDESVLNTTRASVVWLSPVLWHEGSNYGTIRFVFDWSALVEGKDIYWVEAIAYKNNAVRFLIRDKDLPPSPWLKLLKEYDPSDKTGPLRKIGSEWYCARKYTLEILLESNIGVSECLKIDAVQHHYRNCRLHKSRCIEFRRETSVPFAELMGYLIGVGIHSADNSLSKEKVDSGVSYYPNLQMPVLWLKNNLYKQVDFTGPVASPDHVRCLLKSACVQLGLGQGLDARNLVRMIGSKNVADQQFGLLVEEHFGVPLSKLLP